VRACDVHDVPCATNLSTARIVLAALDRLGGEVVQA
jgi:methylglyoxal synthase